jgi:hypothetical protein
MLKPEARFMLEPPGGLTEITATCRNGKAERIRVRNVPSIADELDVALEVPGVGTLIVDTAYGGDSFVIADAQKLGFRDRAGRGPRHYRNGHGVHQGGRRAARSQPSPKGLESFLVLPDRRSADSWPTELV